MATTKLWHIKGRLKDLLAYVENPEKTMAEKPDLQPLWDVLSYVQRPAATEQGEYVTAVNCLKEIALQQMIQTKKRFGKEDKTMLEYVTIQQAGELDAYGAHHMHGHFMQSSLWGRVKQDWPWIGIILRDCAGTIRGTIALLRHDSRLFPGCFFLCSEGTDFRQHGSLFETGRRCGGIFENAWSLSASH